jgi:hypothetical protein
LAPFLKAGLCCAPSKNPLAESPMLRFLDRGAFLMRSDAENLKYWQIRAADARAMADATADAAARQKMLDVATAVYDKLAQRAERALNDAAKTTTRRPDYVAGTQQNVESWDL